MFSDHFGKKTAHLSKNSDMKCVYFYNLLTPEKARLMKKLLDNKMTLRHFEEFIIAESVKCSYDYDRSSDSSCKPKPFTQKCSISSASDS